VGSLGCSALARRLYQRQVGCRGDGPCRDLLRRRWSRDRRLARDRVESLPRQAPAAIANPVADRWHTQYRVDQNYLKVREPAGSAPPAAV